MSKQKHCENERDNTLSTCKMIPHMISKTRMPYSKEAEVLHTASAISQSKKNRYRYLLLQSDFFFFPCTSVLTPTTPSQTMKLRHQSICQQGRRKMDAVA